MRRDRIELKDTMQSSILKMAESNPGALNILVQMLSKGHLGFMKILDLDDMNIRGEQIWVGYKDHCGQDLDKFMECAKNRDEEMINTINNECGSRHTAVKRGASEPTFVR